MTNEDCSQTIFCFPYKGTGGVSLLFLNIAELLAARGVNTAIVDYADGFMAVHRTEARLQLIRYDDGADVQIPENCAVVFQSLTPWSIYPSLRIPASVRVLFWNLYPFNLVPTLPGFRRSMHSNQRFGRLILATLLRGYRERMRRLITLLQRRHSLAFMDRTNLETTESYLQIKIDEPVMLAVGIPTASAAPVREQRNLRRVGLRCAWIGRIVDFKYFSLKHALEELNRIQPELGLPLEFIIVGTGNYQSRLRALTNKLPRLDVRLIEHLPPSSIGPFLMRQVDVLFAMGTSALEGARMGIPTVLLDMSYKTVSAAYEFQWLHKEDGFTMGRLITVHAAEGLNDSMRQRMLEAIDHYPALSAMALAYFETHHSVAQISTNLQQIIAGSQCTYGDLERNDLLGRGVAYSSFAAIRKLSHGGW